jgi:hypothetical protein
MLNLQFWRRVMTPAADRQRRYRQRQQRGSVVYRLDVDRDVVLGGLLESGRLTEGEALRRQLVERALAEVLEEWAARWLKK